MGGARPDAYVIDQQTAQTEAAHVGAHSHVELAVRKALERRPAELGAELARDALGEGAVGRSGEDDRVHSAG